MSEVQKLEQRIQSFSESELAQFRAWFAEFDAKAWESQIERDAATGKLDALANKALRDHAAGVSRPL